MDKNEIPCEYKYLCQKNNTSGNIHSALAETITSKKENRKKFHQGNTPPNDLSLPNRFTFSFDAYNVHLLITKIWIVFDEMTHFSQLVFLDPKRCKQFSNLHFEFRWTSLWNLLSFSYVQKSGGEFYFISDDTSNSFCFG